MMQTMASRPSAAQPDPNAPRGLEQTGDLLAELHAAQQQLQPLQAVIPAARSIKRALRRCTEYLAQPFRIAILGEFNTGKSSLTNLLIGRNAMPTAVVACTRRPTCAHYARVPSITVYDSEGGKSDIGENGTLNGREIIRIDVGLPERRLMGQEIWDMPEATTASCVVQNLRLMRHPPDIVIWCTSSTQAWKESERNTWSQLPVKLRANSILVATYADLLASNAERQSVMSRLRAVASDLFDDVAMLSSIASGAPASGPDTAGTILPGSWHGLAALEKVLHLAVVRASQARAADVRGLLSRQATRNMTRVANA